MSSPASAADSPAAVPVRAAPRRHRLAVFVFLGVYPLVTAMIYLVGALTPGWQIWHRTLVMVPIIVTAMIWIIIPLIHRRLGHLL